MIKKRIIKLKKIILIRYGEITLKGLNRPIFENRLIKNIKREIHSFGKTNIIKSQARIYIEPEEDIKYNFEEVIKKLVNIMGIVSVSIVMKIKTDFEELKEKSLEYINDLILKNDYKTFKVSTKRGNKNFPLESPKVNEEIGGNILDNIKYLSVDVHKPDFIFYIEIREFIYIYSEIIAAFGGIPIGTSGKALLLLSGGIDSPVAGWMMAKRGVELEAIHFYSYPYTSERAKEKVIDLTKILVSYCHSIKLHIVPFTDIQLEILEKCPKDQLVILMRRAMMNISEKIAIKSGAQALITGESLGQVASQTMESLSTTNNATSLLVFRPLIGMDKNEIIDIARKINTFETSILPYEDCCTVFVSKHPVTKPNINKIIESESKIELLKMIEKAINDTEIVIINSSY